MNRHTPKKAVMVDDAQASARLVCVDTQATVAVQAVDTPAKG
ncbi:MAG: hypothetical protein AAF004_11690 [Pseudomonadota bacterium]